MTIQQFEKADYCLRRLHRLREQAKKLEIATRNVTNALQTPVAERCFSASMDNRGGKMLSVSIYSYSIPASDATIKYLLNKEKKFIDSEIDKFERMLESI